MLLWLAIASPGQAEELVVTTTDDTDILVNHYPATGEYLLLWLAPEYGWRPAHRELARRLAADGIEVWQVDIAEALFLPRGAASLRRLDGSYIAELIEQAHTTSAKKILVAGDSYAAANALIGIHRWQSRTAAETYLVGAILFTPYAYATIPPLGLPPDYLPVISATNIPIMLYQAKNSATTAQLDVLLQKLRSHDSPVYTRMLPEVMSLFYEEEPTPGMIAAASRIPRDLARMIPLLQSHRVPQQPPPLASSQPAASGIDIYLREYKGASPAFAIDLPSVAGPRVIRENYRGRVTLVNFWASWCGPCVEEIPSLNRLQQQMAGKPFELISINYAEDKATIDDFMRRVEVDFPVLLDHDGSYAKRWQVITFPSTFVIAPDGSIRYGVNAAIEWDTPELVDKLDALLD